jgi:tRNA(fMet)-specific endonuclease VapC
VIRFLLDTNIISEPVRLRPNPEVINKLKEHEFEIVMASVT